jgi:hypothetical protein
MILAEPTRIAPAPEPLAADPRTTASRTPRVPQEVWRTVDPDVLTTLSEEITRLSARVAAETYRLLSLIAEFDRLEGWRREGFASCVEWLAYSTRIDKMTAREKVRVARALARLPETSAAMARGEISFSQVRAITRVADAESELELLEHASEMSAAALERLVRSWKRLDHRNEARSETRRHALRCLSVFPDEDGSFLIRGRLDPEVGALLMRAIEAASDVMYRGSVPDATPEQRRADAIGLLAERALTAGLSEAPHGTSAERYMVVLHVEEGAIEIGAAAGRPSRSSLEDGTRVSAETSRRIACDATVVRTSVRAIAGGSAAGEPLPRGPSRTRSVPPRMRRALELRDRGCRFPGCGSRFTDAHHIRHWADGGATHPENLILLCRTHHRLLHEGGFRLEPNPKEPGRPYFLSPRGFRIPETPPRMRIRGCGHAGGQRRDAHDRTIGGPSTRWEEDVPLGFYLDALSGGHGV